METFQKVKCSERLPDEKTIADTDKGQLIYHPIPNQWRTLAGRWREMVPNWWLEELPPQEQMTVEKTRKIINEVHVQINKHMVGDKTINLDKVKELVVQAIHDLMYKEKEKSQFGDSLTLFEDVNGGYTILLPELPNLITEAEEIKDVPKRLTEAFEVMLEYMIESKKYKIISPADKQ